MVTNKDVSMNQLLETEFLYITVYLFFTFIIP